LWVNTISTICLPVWPAAQVELTIESLQDLQNGTARLSAASQTLTGSSDGAARWRVGCVRRLAMHCFLLEPACCGLSQLVVPLLDRNLCFNPMLSPCRFLTFLCLLLPGLCPRQPSRKRCRRRRSPKA
jgi:hypothetical protein